MNRGSVLLLLLILIFVLLVSALRLRVGLRVRVRNLQPSRRQALILLPGSWRDARTHSARSPQAKGVRRPAYSLHLRLQLGEENHVADVFLAEQHHAEAIDPHAHRSEEHTSELQSLAYLVCRLLLEKKK